jgi:Protein of unknown function (DUF1449)
MDEFLRALMSGGVAPYTALLIATGLYWLLVILGAVDLDILHLSHEVDGHGHGHGHGPAGDGDGHHPHWFSGFFEFLSLGRVPLTVILSILFFSAWAVAMVLALFGWWWPVVLVGAWLIAVPMTGVACRPLRVVFSSLDRGVKAGISLLGREAHITSATCDASFGTATCLVDDAEMLLDVVAIRPELRFRRDQPVIIVDYDPERERYLVGPAVHLLANAPGPALAEAVPQALTETPPEVTAWTTERTEPSLPSSSSSAPQRQPHSQ